MTQNEQWRDIPGYEGLYQVSDQGRVRSLDRVVEGGRWGTQTVRGQIMSQVLRRDGYPTVQLRREGEREKVLVHRVLLEAFVGLRPEGLEARHLNDVKSDNRLENLKWGTRSENNLDRVTNGIGYYTTRESCKRGHRLVDRNLVPNQLELRGGIKTCYACAKAHYTVKTHADLEPHFQEVSDIHYSNLIGESRRMLRSDFPF